MPERVILVQVKSTGNAHRPAGGLVFRYDLAIEQELVLKGKEVRRIDGNLVDVARPLLTTVAGDEPTASAEAVDGQQTIVRAAPAMDVGMLHLKVVDLLACEDLRDSRCPRAITREQGRAIGAHRAGYVWSDDVAPGQQLEGTQGRITQESPALHNDVLADLVVVTQLYDFEEGIFYHRVREARRDVTYCRSLFLGLLNAGVHKHGATGAEVHGGPAMHGRLGELLN